MELPPELWDIILFELSKINIKTTAIFALISNFLNNINKSNRNILYKLFLSSGGRYIEDPYTQLGWVKGDEYAFHWRIFPSKSYILLEACKNRNLKVLQWLEKKLKLTSDRSRSDDVYMLERFTKKYSVDSPLTPSIESAENSQRSSQRNSTVEIVAWMTDRFYLSREDKNCILSSNIIKNSIINGDLDLLKWLLEKYSITAEEVINHDFLGWACSKGHLDIAEWLTEKYHLMDEPEEDHYRYGKLMGSYAWALNISCRECRIESVKWLVKKFSSTRSRIPISDPSDLLRECYLIRNLNDPLDDEKRLNLVRWLIYKFDISREEILSHKDRFGPIQYRILDGFSRNGSLEIVKYLVKKFGPFSLENIVKAAGMALEEGHIKVAEWLINNPENYHKIDNFFSV